MYWNSYKNVSESVVRRIDCFDKWATIIDIRQKPHMREYNRKFVDSMEYTHINELLFISFVSYHHRYQTRTNAGFYLMTFFSKRIDPRWLENNWIWHARLSTLSIVVFNRFEDRFYWNTFKDVWESYWDERHNRHWTIMMTLFSQGMESNEATTVIIHFCTHLHVFSLYSVREEENSTWSVSVFCWFPWGYCPCRTTINKKQFLGRSDRTI